MPFQWVYEVQLISVVTLRFHCSRLHWDWLVTQGGTLLSKWHQQLVVALFTYTPQNKKPISPIKQYKSLVLLASAYRSLPTFCMTKWSTHKAVLCAGVRRQFMEGAGTDIWAVSRSGDEILGGLNQCGLIIKYCMMKCIGVREIWGKRQTCGTSKSWVCKGSRKPGLHCGHVNSHWWIRLQMPPGN